MMIKITPDLYASKQQRFANYLIDLIINLLLFYGIFFGIIYLSYIFIEDTTSIDLFIYELDNVNPILDRIITAIIMALLYFTFETLLKGKTIGKYATKTKVVLEDGTSPKPIDYLKRSFSRMIPFEALSFLGSEGRGWHDTISNTYVVDVKAFELRLKSESELEQLGKPQF